MSATPAIQPAMRIEALDPDYASEMIEKIREANHQGRGIISLAMVGPDKPPHSLVAETLCEEAYREDVHSYQPQNGLPELREAFARWYAHSFGVQLDPQTEIIPTAGSKDGVLLASLTIINPGDRVLVPDPGNPALSRITRVAGGEPLPYRLTDGGDWEPDLESIEREGLDRVKMMWINYPHMPSGHHATPGLLERIVEFGKRNSIVIAHLNPYSFCSSEPPLSIMSVPGAKEVALEVTSLSRSHNMAGWRVGMVAAGSAMTEWMKKVKCTVGGGMFRPVMKAAATALQLTDKWYSELTRMYRQRAEIAYRLLDALGCSYAPDQSGLYLWARLPASEKSSKEFAERLLDQTGVFVMPGAVFGKGGEGYIRLSLCVPSAKLQIALERIERMMGLPLTPPPARLLRKGRGRRKRSPNSPATTNNKRHRQRRKCKKNQK